MANGESTSWLVDEIQAMVSQAPWWLYSALVHLGVIFVLVLVPFTTIAPPQKKIAIESRVDQIEERVEPPTKVDVLTDEKPDQSQPVLAGSPLETRVAAVMADAQANAPVLAIEAPTANELSKLVDRGTGFTPSAFGGGNAAGLISMRVGASKIGMSYDDVMDNMAEGIVKEIQKNDLLVVLLFDESKSLLEDRKIVMQKINRVVADLRKELKPREAARLKWAVVSYCQKPTLWLQPTDNINEVLESVKKIKIDDSGVENVCAAISYACKTLSPLGKKMYIIVITDEEGDDTHNDKAFTAALHDIEGSKPASKLYVFGRESQFQQENAFEWLRDSKGERVGPWFWAQRGIESCKQEYFVTDWLFNHHRSERLIGSGFGCWSMTTLAELSKGVFFILSEIPSAFDEEKIDKFRPEWVTPAEYADRNSKSKLRTTVRRIIDEWQKMDPPAALVQLDELRKERDEAIAKGEKAMKWSEGAIDEMEVLRGRRSGEKFAKMRWQANFDLLMAGLYKNRFMLRDYLKVLYATKTSGFPKPKPNQKFNYYRILYNTSLTEPRTGQRGLKEWDQAKKALDQVAADYDGTPWGEMAKDQKRTTAPMWIYPAFDVQPTRPRG